MKKTAVLSFLALIVAASLAWAAGPQVMMGGKPVTLMGTALKVGGTLPDVGLPDGNLATVPLHSFKGKVTIVSIVPSIDTAVCEKQTHLLSEKNGGLDKSARLVTISRDLPFAQKRFAKEAKIANVLFLSDYRDASFGMSAGLLIDENRLLTRAVLVLDKDGVIRHLEIVPNLGELPQMEKVFEVARALVSKGS